MRIYKTTCYIMILLLVFSLFILLCIAEPDSKLENMCLGIFTGSFVGIVSAWIGYFVERRKALEEFYCEIIKFHNLICHYDFNDDIDNKIKFFFKIKRYDFFALDKAFRNFDFFFFQRSYIYKKLYNPIKQFRIKLNGYSDAAKPLIRKNGNRLSDSRKPQLLLMRRSRLSGVA